ncbi:MAG TPA: hypothetical protein VFW33_21770 [Gemmataceae bacterium]|nr:hypothetical protein [Gemmataceae bacterium]
MFLDRFPGLGKAGHRPFSRLGARDDARREGEDEDLLIVCERPADDAFQRSPFGAG